MTLSLSVQQLTLLWSWWLFKAYGYGALCLNCWKCENIRFCFFAVGIRRCHYLPPGSLHAMGAFEPLPCSHLFWIDIKWLVVGIYYTYSFGWNFKHALYVCATWDTGSFIEELLRPYCSDVCEYHWCPQTLVGICRNMGICCGCRAAAVRGKYPAFILLSPKKQRCLINDESL